MMNTKIIIVFFVLSIFTGTEISKGQNQRKIDSLETLLETTLHDTAKVNAMVGLGAEFSRSNPWKSFTIINTALLLSQKINYKKGTASCFLGIGNYYFYKSDYKQALEYDRKALKICEELVRLHPETGTEQSVVEGKKGIADCNKNIGTLFFYQGDYTQASVYYKVSLETYKQLHDKKGEASLGVNIGSVYRAQGNYPKALELYEGSLKIYEKLNDKNGMSKCYNNIGVIQYIQTHYTQSLDYFQKALRLTEELGDKKGIADFNMNIGNIYFSTKKFQQAIEYYSKSVKIYETLGDKKGMADNYHNIGNVYSNMGKYQQALEYADKALKIRETIGDKEGMTSVLNNIAALEIEQKNYSKALEYAKKSLAIAEEIGAIEKQKNAYQSLSAVYDSLGNTKEALKYYKFYTIAKDSLFSEEKQKQLTKMEAVYQNEKKQKEIELLSKDTELQKTEIKRQTTQKYAFIGGFIFMLALAFVIFKSYRQKQKDNKILLQQKEEIQAQKEELHAINEQLAVTLSEVEALNIEFEKQNTQILDSINFAKLIQDAILPSEEMIKNAFPESFIFFQPKDIVSGDFYWLHTAEDKILIVLADCTGHGVPGAFMSMIGNSLLNQIIKQQKIYSPAAILENLNIEINSILSQSGQDYDAGMDVTVCCIDKETNHIIVSLAGHTVYFIQDGKIIEKSEDLLSIGGALSRRNKSQFINHTIKIKNNLLMYLTSDGYYDQFGGEDMIKFNNNRFKQLLSDIAPYNMEQQKGIVASAFIEWKGNNKQIDDITVIGLQFY